ncbi:hypothetical protein ACFL2Y_04285 [Candidatus Omnitrophota bacterium]
MFLTSGVPFFWEDFEAYYVDEIKNPYTMPGILVSALKEFVAPQRLFRIGFANTLRDRPYQRLTDGLLGLLFGNNVIFYRMIKSLVLAATACVLFLMIKRASTSFAFLGVCLYITSPVTWLNLASSMDVAVYAQFSILLSFALFLHVLEKNKSNQITHWIFYSLILLTSQYAVLARNDGRYLAVIFLLTVFFFHKKMLGKHISALVVLLLFEIPILGFIGNIFKENRQPVIDLSSHSSVGLIASLKGAAKNYIFPLHALGIVLVGLFVLAIGIHIVTIIVDKKYSKNKHFAATFIHERSFAFFLWFLFTFIMIVISRGFNYQGLADFTFIECSFFLLPFILFLCYFLCLIKTNFSKPYRTIFIVACTIVMGMQILIVNLPRLNHSRGGWGNYFCAWDNAKKYIEKTTNDALVFTIYAMRYKPFVFWKSRNEVIPSIYVSREHLSEIVQHSEGLFSNLVTSGYIDERGIIQNKFRSLHDASEMIIGETYFDKKEEIFKILSIGFVLPAERSPFCELTYLENKLKTGNFKDIFVVNRGKLNFRDYTKGVSLHNEVIVDGDSGDFYDRFKRIIGRHSKPVIHIYHFRAHDESFSG